MRVLGTALIAIGMLFGCPSMAADLAVTFDQTAAGAVPEGWKVGATNGGAEPARWVVEEIGGRKVFSLVEPERRLPGDLYNVAWMPGTKVKDVDATVSIRANKGSQDQGGGLIWRASDANNYYVARYNPLEGNFRLYHVKDGRRTQLATAENLPIGTGEWFTMRIVQRGDHIEGYINGQKVLDARDRTFAEAGAIGLWTKADATTSFDDLVVKDL
ncbi:MAG: DUF1080 domain-containing protein [Alphaproteobacteria bacterium]|nr:DUF1080 domain-containing protein [Alphaproteobacteria bacterium]